MTVIILRVLNFNAFYVDWKIINLPTMIVLVFSACSRTNQKPYTGQITEIAPNVRAYLWVTI